MKRLIRRLFRGLSYVLGVVVMRRKTYLGLQIRIAELAIQNTAMRVRLAEHEVKARSSSRKRRK